MENERRERLREYFENLPDPRIEQIFLHRLIYITKIAMCAVICGADDWVLAAMFWKAKEDRFRSVLELQNMIPSTA